MSALSWTGNAVVQHLNVRKQGPDDEKELALDVKLCADARADVLGYFGDSLAAFLFLPDGSLRFPMMDPVSWGGEIKHITLTLSAHEFYGVTLKRFSFAPSAGGKVAMTFSASFAPEAREAALIAELLAEVVLVEITPQADLLSTIDPETGEISTSGTVAGKTVTATEKADGTVRVMVTKVTKAAKPQAQPKDARWPFPVGSKPAMEVD